MEGIAQFLNKIETPLALLIFGVIYMVFKVFTFVYEIIKEKQKDAEKDTTNLEDLLAKNITVVRQLESDIKMVQDTLAQIPKLQKDLRRYYTAIKYLAGNDWPTISKVIVEEEEFLNK